MKKNLIVKQDGYKECGAACLLSIIRFYKGNVSINRLVEWTHTDKFGTTFYNLKDASEKFGLEAIGYKVENINSLLDLKQPYICQLINNNYEHFVVVYKLKKNKVIIMDPAIGERIISIEEFMKLWTGYIMIFSPKKKLLNFEEKKYLNNIIVNTLLKNKSIVFNILILSIMVTIATCLYALYFEFVIEKIIDTTKNNLLIVTFIFVIILIIKCIANFFRMQLLIILNQKFDCSIFLKTFQKLLLLPYSYYKNKTTGEIISRLNDLIYVKSFLNKIILTVFLDFIIFVGTGILLFRMNYILFGFLVLIILINLLIFYIFRPLLKRLTEKNQEHNALINSNLVEVINSYETIKNMSMESLVNEKMSNIYVHALSDSFDYENLGNLEMFMKEFISFIGFLLIEFLGFSLVIDQKLSLGEFLTFTTLASCFIEPIKGIIDLNREYYYAINSLKRVNHLLDIDIEDLSTKTNFEVHGKIKLQNLSFSYNDQKNNLNNINLEIKVGERAIILGDSGSGKSTILKLLLKYYLADRDMIYIDNIDINDYCIKNIRDNISCVSQNEILYTDTIKNNIIMNRKITDEQFIKVCKIARVDEIVKKFFLGYETKLEENGLNLSGGERQRIILARMLLKTSKIMLIDEGLNAVDIDLERKILKDIFSEYMNCTIIVVSHRTENLDLFQKIVYLKDSSIKEVITYPKVEVYDR